MKTLLLSFLSTSLLVGIALWKIGAHKKDLRAPAPPIPTPAAVVESTPPAPPVATPTPEEVLQAWQGFGPGNPATSQAFEKLDALPLDELETLLEGEVSDELRLYAMIRLSAAGAEIPDGLSDFDEGSFWSAIATTDPDRALSLAEAKLDAGGVPASTFTALLATLAATHPNHAIRLSQCIFAKSEPGNLFSLRFALGALREHEDAWRKLASAASDEPDPLASAQMFSLLFGLGFGVPMEELAPTLHLPDPWPSAVEHPALSIYGYFAKTETDQQKWIDWLWKTVPHSVQARAAEKIVQTWGGQDAEAAGNWMAALGDGPEWDKARVAYARAVRMDHPRAALAWMERLSPGRGQIKLARDIFRDWNKADSAAARQWLAGSSFDPTTRSWLRGSLTE